MESLYADGDQDVFMHPVLRADPLTKELLKNSLSSCAQHGVTIDMFDGRRCDPALMTVELRIVETEPGLRGATATASMSGPTTQSLVVHVPQFVTEGEVVRVDTTEGKYIERVS